jgi:pimeloyl-ACP methyl ester carboxylesterase
MGTIAVGNINWHYETLCEGTDTLFAFHGIGQTPNDWQVIVPFLEGRFRVIAFYLPHHGPFEMAIRPLVPDDFELLTKAMLTLSKGKASVIGHSIGARLAISLFFQTNSPFEQLVLTAPDGIRDSFIYRFATRTALGRWIMKALVRRPELVMKVASALSGIGIIPPGLYRFIESQYNSKEKAERIRSTWIALSWPSFSYKRLNELLKEGKKVVACFGKHDRVIRPSIGRKLAKNSQAKVVFLDKGHNLLHGDRLGLLLQAELYSKSKTTEV